MDTTPTIEQKVDPASTHQDAGILSPDVSMMILTWITFFSLLAILYKFAWRPILDALNQREDTIKRAIAEADEIKRQMLEMNAKQEAILNEARQKSQQMIEESRKSALELAKLIQDKAKQESQILLNNAKRELEAEIQKARFSLRKESVELAVKLAAKVVHENMDEEKNRKLVDQLINQIE